MANQVWNRLSQITSNYKNSQQAPSLNNNQYSSYYSKLYPGLNEESYNKMANAVDSLGLTGENRANAMNNYYRTHVKTLINDQTLQERDDIINQQAYEAAKLNNKDADAELRMTEAVQKAKKLWNLDATANDREVFSSMVETLGADGTKLAGEYLSGENDEFLYKTGLEQREKAPNERLTWGDTWDNIRTKANVPVDSMKKWGQRTFDKLGAMIYKDVLKNTLGDAVDGKLEDVDNYVQFFAEKSIEPRLRENALNYQQGINERYQALEQKNMDQDIKNYYDNKGYTELIGEGDLKGFMYKSLGDAAQNWEMPVVVAASVVQPEIGMALMATDSYARENQEAFENMLNNGATYEQAEQGAVVVGLVNAAVEVTLEKLIGGVETTAGDTIRKTLMKNVQEEATKKGLGRILVEGVGTQLRASGEEGLEEIVQQIVQNAAAKTVNENQELFEGVGQAFEGGFYNPMNLLAGGGNLTQNISQNKDTINQQLGDTAYNAGVMTRKTVDGFTDAGSFMKDKATAIKQMAKERLNRKNGQNVTTENVETETTEKTENPGVIDRITDWGAEKITNTVSAQDKLYKAQEPRMNVLSKKKDIEKRREHSDRANQLIVQNGYIPTNTAERLEAHETTMKNIWKQVEDRINGGQEIMVDLSQIADVLDDYIQSQRDTKSTLTEGDLAKLEKESQALRGQQVSLPVAERLKQLYNAVINNRGEEKASDTMANGLQKATHEIGVIEDNLLSEIPGEFQGLKNDFGALKDTYEDVFKADMKNQKKKGSGLTETYSRIEGIGDIANGLLGVATGKGDMASIGKGAAKFLVGKSLAKASDVDFLIEQGFKELAQGMGENQNVGLDKSQVSSKTAKYQVADQTQTPEFKKWFEGSKIVDNKGNPLRVYHGTHNDFTIFDREKIGSNTNNKGIFGEGFYFTNRKSYGDYYAQPGFSKDFNSLEGKTAADIEKLRGTTMELYLDIKNPFRWNEINTKDKMNKLIEDLGLKKGDLRWNNTYNDQIAPITDAKKSIKFREALQKAGYDGVVYEFKGDINGEKQLEYVAFEPNQIKSATDNVGTFDRDNPDIRFQKYGVAGQGEKGMSATEGLNIRNFKNGKSVQELANQYGIDTKIVDSISTPEGQRAYGMYGDRLITLSKDLVESTVPHELLHGVFDMVDSKRKATILGGIEKNLNVDSVQAEEWLADSFSEYYRTGKFAVNNIANTLVEKIKSFFRAIKEYIDGTYANRKEIRQLFDDIIDGKIEGEYGVYSDPKFQSVWHGSPYSFDKFDSSHMGEGEGAQAHGWGHYVAVDENTGRAYANKLTGTTRKGRETFDLAMDLNGNEWNVIREITDKMDIEGVSAEEGIESSINRHEYLLKEAENDLKEQKWEDDKKYYERKIEDQKKMLDFARGLVASDFESSVGKRNLYEVEIPDPVKADTPTGSNYFEEKDVLNDKEIKKLKDVFKKTEGTDLELFSSYRDGRIDGVDVYRSLKQALNSDKAASQFLESLGYDGIHYFGGRDGEAYVIFNDDALEITKHHKY